jgi:uncharacterized protein YoxC
MDFAEVLNIVLPLVYVLVGVALIWFVVELALFAKSARGALEDTNKSLAPTLANVEKATAQAEPLLERVTLTVDATNLELMRVDQILEDVTQITGSVSKAADAVDTVTNAPLDLVNSVTSRIRDKFKPQYASKESVDLGAESKVREERAAKQAVAAQSASEAAPVTQAASQAKSATQAPAEATAATEAVAAAAATAATAGAQASSTTSAQ